MPAFDYSAVDVSGHTVAGVLTAPDEAAAKTALAVIREVSARLRAILVFILRGSERGR